MTPLGWREAPEAEYAVLGNPIKHSLSPTMHMAAYAALDLPYRYVGIETPVEELPMALRRLAELGYRGVNLTVPLKFAVLELLKRKDSVVSRTGAANTVRLSDWSGANTDVPGFLATLNELDLSADDPALVLGVGGAGIAVIVALEQAGFPCLAWNRTHERALARLQASGCGAKLVGSPSLKGVKLIVNATSASLGGESLPIDWSEAAPDAVAYDLAYGGVSPFLQGAERVGLRTVDGKRMLMEQGALAFEWWLGLPAPREAMWRAIQ